MVSGGISSQQRNSSFFCFLLVLCNLALSYQWVIMLFAFFSLANSSTFLLYTLII